MIILSEDYQIFKREWVKQSGIKFYDRFRPKTDRTISSNFKADEIVSVPYLAEDYAIEMAVRSGVYTPQKPMIIRNPYGLTPLCALVGFQTDKECRVRSVVLSKKGAQNIVVTAKKGRYHRVPVLGLYPGEQTSVRIEILDSSEKVKETIVFSLYAPKLPPNMRNTVAVKKHSADSAFPLVLVSGGNTDYPFAFDENGDIRYYVKVTTKSYGVFLLSGGLFLQQVKYALEPTFSNPHGVILRERDWLGRVHRNYYVENGTHHDVQEMTPGGNLLACYSNLSTSTENSIIEIDRNTGEIVKQVDVDQILDKSMQKMQDWIHVNTVSYDAVKKTVLACSRNLHTVMQIDWETGKLDWLLGHPDFWKNTSVEDKLLKWEAPDMPWFFQAHAAYFLPEDLDGNPDTRHLILFDNHWHKRTPVPFFDEERKGSYGKIYCINDKKRTVSFVKEFEAIKSPIRANALYVHDKKRVFVMSSYLVETTDDGHDGMLYEYDYNTGKLYNQYGVFHSFFRAYGFFPEMEKAGEPMDYEDGNIELGRTRSPELVEGVDFSACKKIKAVTVPEIKQEIRRRVKKLQKAVKRIKKNREEQKDEAALLSGEGESEADNSFVNDSSVNPEGSEEGEKGPVRKVRKEMKIKEYKENNMTNELDKEGLEREIRKIMIGRCGWNLFLNCRDHLIQNVYLRGNNAVYRQNYTNTRQVLPAVFGNMHYTMSICIEDLPPDTYRVYLEIEDAVYQTRWTFTIAGK